MASRRLCQRTLSAFKSSRYAQSQAPQQLALASDFSLTTWNIDAFSESSRPVARAKLILDGILEEAKRPDIPRSHVRRPFLYLRQYEGSQSFPGTDAEDQTSFEGVPFANMTLLSNKRFAFDLEPQKEEEEEEEVEGWTKFMLGSVSRVKLPSKYGRCAISVDPPTHLIHPINSLSSHQRSSRFLGDTLPYRTEQIEIIANLLRDPGCGGGLIAGDFNTISPGDHALLDKDGVVDAWLAL